MERAAKKRAHNPVTIPAHFKHRCFVSGQFQRGTEAIGGTAGMDHEIAIAPRFWRLCETNTERGRQFRAIRIDVDKGNVGPRQPAAEIRNERTDDARPDDRDAVGWARRGIPHTIKRGFQVAARTARCGGTSSGSTTAEFAGMLNAV